MTAIRKLAEHMVDFFSEDAAQWPLTESNSRPDAPIRVAFRWFGSEVPGFGRDLLGHMASILAAPYRNAVARQSAALSYTSELEDADVEVVLAEATGADGAPGVGYEIVFSEVGERYPGWFALPDG
jgi:hypothetical protein